MKIKHLATAFTAIMILTTGSALASKCSDFTRHQERLNGIPAHLLTAIAMTESGHWDSRTRQGGPWPWTVTSPEGDIKYPSKWAAIQAVRDLKRRGVRNIDVGCMQINLKHHKRAFRNLNHAFDPAQNVAYAARFLTRLYRESGDWRMAMAYYHSRNPKHYLRYQAKVEDAWQKLRGTAANVDNFPAPAYNTPRTYAWNRDVVSRPRWSRRTSYRHRTWPTRRTTAWPSTSGSDWRAVTGGRFQ